MSKYERIAAIGDIPSGQGRLFESAGRPIAVFHLDGRFHALSDTCPHMCDSLSAGWIEDGAVVCPRHQWRFDLKTGTCLDEADEKYKAKTYPVRVEGDEVFVQVDPNARS